jgi:hypothetical protein
MLGCRVEAHDSLWGGGGGGRNLDCSCRMGEPAEEGALCEQVGVGLGIESEGGGACGPHARTHNALLLKILNYFIFLLLLFL